MRRLLLALLIALEPAAAFAFELDTPVTDSVTVVETLKALYDKTDPDVPFGAFVNRLNLQVGKGPFLAGVRYDTEAYFLEKEYYVRYIPEKFFFQYDQKPVLARLGDSYVRFGHGMTLSMLKRDEFGLDTTVQGALVKVATDYFEVEAIGGPVNPGDDSAFTPVRAQLEEPEFFDERDLVWGARMMAGHPQYFRAGGSCAGGLLRFDPDSDYADFERDDLFDLYSVIFEAPKMGGVGSIEGEYAWFEFINQKKSGIEDIRGEGRAAYLLSTWYIGPVTFVAEGTDYFRFGSPTDDEAFVFPYHEPPSMEYTDISFGHLPNFQDTIGGRGRADYTIPAIDLNVFVNYTNIQTHKVGPNDTPPADLAEHYQSKLPWETWIEHIFGGVDKNFANGASANALGGCRDIPEGRYVHGQAELNTPIVYPHSIDVKYRIKQFHGMAALQGSEYSDHEADLTYGYAPYFSLTGSYEWSDEPASGITSEKTDEEEGPNYWAVESVVQPAEWARISLGYGRYKGGLKCAGGVCRQTPPFEGFKSEFSFRF
jgi:hypothetical protein